LDRARQQESEGALAPEAAPAVAPEIKAQQAPKTEERGYVSRYDRLLAQAKEKIAAQDCPAALKLLQEAQKIHDTEEVKGLIAQCGKK
jgi:ferritin-like metal-binding protein YciE